MAAILYETRRSAGWTTKLLRLLADLCRAVPAPAETLAELNTLSDRQLEDIGAQRTEREWKLDRDMAELRRKGIGPLV